MRSKGWRLAGPLSGVTPRRAGVLKRTRGGRTGRHRLGPLGIALTDTRLTIPPERDRSVRWRDRVAGVTGHLGAPASSRKRRVGGKPGATAMDETSARVRHPLTPAFPGRKQACTRGPPALVPVVQLRRLGAATANASFQANGERARRAAAASLGRGSRAAAKPVRRPLSHGRKRASGHERPTLVGSS